MHKFGFVVLVLVLASSALGLGYASWNKSLSIDGTVNTGTLEATIDVNPPGLVSSVEYATITEGDSTNTSLVVNIENAAGGNVFTVNYSIVNTGSIPINVAFTTPVIAASGVGATAADITISAPPTPVSLDTALNETNSITITVNDTAPMTGGISYTITLGIAATPV